MNIYFTWSLWWYISLDSVLGSYSMISINYLSHCSAHRHLASLSLRCFFCVSLWHSLSLTGSLSQTLTLWQCLSVSLPLTPTEDFYILRNKRKPKYANTLCLSPTDCHSNLSHWVYTSTHSGPLLPSAVFLVTCTLLVHCSDHSILDVHFQYVIQVTPYFIFCTFILDTHWYDCCCRVSCVCMNIMISHTCYPLWHLMTQPDVLTSVIIVNPKCFIIIISWYR